MKQFKVGLQLYSIRDELAKDFEGALRAVKAMGYDYVEPAGQYGGRNGKELKALLDEIGLKAPSIHEGGVLPWYQENGDSAFDFFADLGVTYIVIPAYSADKLAGSPDWPETKALFCRVAEAAKKHGMKILYHNHDFEFRKLPSGAYLYDEMFADLKGYVDPQPDTCWMNYGGVDPASYIRKYGDRISVVHLKDLACPKLPDGPLYPIIRQMKEEGRPVSHDDTGIYLTPLGQGRNNFHEILAACEEVGADYVVVEQDNFTGMTPMEGVAASRSYLKETFGI